jgi:hypothetical protein
MGLECKNFLSNLSLLAWFATSPHLPIQEMRKGNTAQERIWSYEVNVPTAACDIAFCVGEFDVIQGACAA